MSNSTKYPRLLARLPGFSKEERRCKDIPFTPEEIDRLDFLTIRHTAFSEGFRHLIDAPGGYFPSLYANVARACILADGLTKITAKDHRAELKELADAYDKAQAYRGDKRRAFRT